MTVLGHSVALSMADGIVLGAVAELCDGAERVEGKLVSLEADIQRIDKDREAFVNLWSSRIQAMGTPPFVSNGRRKNPKFHKTLEGLTGPVTPL